MKVVLHIPSGRLVYRELPEPPDKLLLQNALVDSTYSPNELVVVEVDEGDWDREWAQRVAERPVPVDERLADLDSRVKALEKRVL